MLFNRKEKQFGGNYCRIYKKKICFIMAQTTANKVSYKIVHCYLLL